ncbi:MAG: C39 family peptidase [Oscillospiraceae bacterium]
MSKKKKKNNNNFKAAAAVFGVAVIAAVTTFVLSGRRSDIDTAPVVETDMLNISTTSPEETVPTPPPETSATKAYVVTANTEDLLPDDYVPPGTEDSEDSTEEVYAEEESSDETTAPAQTRTVITSRERTEFNGKSVYIDMKNISQNPELPVGCEITALTILLNYWGFDAEKCDMARNYLPISSGRYKYEDGKTYKDSFYDYFIGDPFSRGYGCFANAIEKAANSYINQHGGGYTVKNISGCSPDTLYSYVEDNIPVLIWATDGMIEPEYYETWYDIDTGEQLDWYLNEHCAVLAGFDIDNDTVTLNDPMKGIIDYNINKFETRFAQMHSQAIVILPDQPAEEEAEITEETTISEEYIEEEYTETVTYEDDTEEYEIEISEEY